LRYQQRDPRLPPEWHNLLDATQNRTVYYNSLTTATQWEPPALLPGSVAAPTVLNTPALIVFYILRGLLQLVIGLLKPLMTVGVYFSLLSPGWYLLSSMKTGAHSHWASLLSSISFLVLPQPLPLVILGLAYFVPLPRIPVSPYESFLSLALLASLLPEILSFMSALARAARARLPAYDLAWDFRLQRQFLCALCPALSWRFWPSAFRLSFDRVALLPLPFGVPLQFPGPKWELIGRSWTALLYAAPMVLPLARLIQAHLESVEPLKLADFCGLVLKSRPLQMSVLVSVVAFVLRKHREMYAAAVEERAEEERVGSAEEATSLENLDQKLLEDFDQRLGSG
jgi:hypothetical protein